MPSAERSEARLRVPGQVAEALLVVDLPSASPAERRAAGRRVDDAVAEMPDVARLGVRVVGSAVYGVLSLLGRAPYGTLPEHRRAVLAARLFRRPLPLVGEFGTLTRGLGLVEVTELRGLVLDEEPGR